MSILKGKKNMSSETTDISTDIKVKSEGGEKIDNTNHLATKYKRLGCIGGLAAGVLIASLVYSCPIGSVDLGHGIKMSKAEYKNYEDAYESSVKEAALEMVVVENALKEKGVTVDKKELSEKIKEAVKESKEQGNEMTESEAMMGCKVDLLSSKAVDKFKEEISVEDNDINNIVAEQSEYSLVSGPYKVVSPEDAQNIEDNGIAFDDIDSRFTVIESNYGTDMSVNDPKDAVVGQVSYGNSPGGNVFIMNVESITNDSPTIREMVKSNYKDRKAQEEFQKFVADVLSKYQD